MIIFIFLLLQISQQMSHLNLYGNPPSGIVCSCRFQIRVEIGDEHTTYTPPGDS